MNGTCPLALLSEGTEAVIKEVRAGKGMKIRLSDMGLCPETKVRVQCVNCGSLIVSVGDSRYALSRGMASKILVSGLEEAA